MKKKKRGTRSLDLKNSDLTTVEVVFPLYLGQLYGIIEVMESLGIVDKFFQPTIRQDIENLKEAISIIHERIYGGEIPDLGEA